MIHPNSHPTYNERHEKIIELIDWTWEKYKETAAANIKKMKQNEEQEEIIIENIIEELDKKRNIASEGKQNINYSSSINNN